MIRKGLWSPEEDEKLRRSISKYVNGSWNDIAHKAGLQRCGRSCRQRWLNHLRPGLRKDKFSKDEMKQVLELQAKLGNRWSEIAAQMNGRTDNEVKNLWNTVIKRRRLRMLDTSSQSASYLLPLADSPSHDTASSQSGSSSHSTWSLHASPGPADVDFCSSLASHGFMDVDLSDQLLMINGQDLSHAPSIKGQDALHVDQHAARGQLSASCSLISPPLGFESHDEALLMPPPSPCLDPHWDSTANANLSYTPTLPCKSFTSHNIIESGKSSSYNFSFIPSQKSSNLDSNMIPSFQSRECFTLLSKALETPSTFENGHCLKSLLLPQQIMSIEDHASSHDHAPTPNYPVIIMNHEDGRYALNLDISNDACDSSSPASSVLEASFHRFEYGTQDIIASLLWNTGYHE